MEKLEFAYKEARVNRKYMGSMRNELKSFLEADLHFKSEKLKPITDSLRVISKKSSFYKEGRICSFFHHLYNHFLDHLRKRVKLSMAVPTMKTDNEEIENLMGICLDTNRIFMEEFFIRKSLQTQEDSLSMTQTTISSFKLEASPEEEKPQLDMLEFERPGTAFNADGVERPESSWGKSMMFKPQ